MPLQLDLGRAILRELVQSDAPSLAQHANDRLIWVQLRDMFPYPYREEDVPIGKRTPQSLLNESKYRTSRLHLPLR